MKLYREVTIETVEQTEALPEGTVVLEVLTDDGHERVIGADHIDDSFDEDLTPGGNWHYVALVPIEAEEETGSEWIGPDGDLYESTDRPTLTRLVTPWTEEA